MTTATEQQQLGQPAELCRYCRRCHRRLKAERAMRLGYGRICYLKVKSESNDATNSYIVARQ